MQPDFSKTPGDVARNTLIIFDDQHSTFADKHKAAPKPPAYRPMRTGSEAKVHTHSPHGDVSRGIASVVQNLRSRKPHRGRITPDRHSWHPPTTGLRRLKTRILNIVAPIWSKSA